MSLQEIYGLIEPTDTRKINTVLGLYDHYVNGKEISARLNMTKPGRMTPMMFELNLIERAKANKMRIVLAEGEEPRILQATDILLRREVAEIILLGNADKINKAGPRTAPRHQQGHHHRSRHLAQVRRLRRHLRRTAQGQGRDHRTRPRRHERRHLLRHHDGQEGRRRRHGLRCREHHRPHHPSRLRIHQDQARLLRGLLGLPDVPQGPRAGLR